jgi:hypothetical protein
MVLHCAHRYGHKPAWAQARKDGWPGWHHGTAALLRVSVHHNGQRVDQNPARAKPIEIRDHVPRLDIRADNFDGFEFGILRLQH